MKLALVWACIFFSSLHSNASIVPNHEVLRTKNGIDVYYFTSPTIPIFQIDLVFNGGSDADPTGKSGLTAFTAAMIQKGTGSMDEEALTARLDDLAAGFDVSPTGEKVVVSAYGLNEHAGEIIDLAFNQIVAPIFPEKPFQRLKANHLDNIDHVSDSAPALAAYVLDLIVHNGTVKARPGSGFRREIKATTLADVKAYFPNLLRTDHLKALVIGGKNKEEILEKVVRNLELLPCPACKKNEVLPRAFHYSQWRAPRAQEVVLIERPGVSEAHVRIGSLGPRRKIPEFYDLRVAETILAGQYASRMNLLIREKLNLTYDISAGFDFGSTSGTFLVSTSTRNEKVGVLLTQVRKLLTEFATGEVTEGELQHAKDFITGAFPLMLRDRYVIASTFFTGVVNGLDANFLDLHQDAIGAVTLESVKAAIKKHFNPQNLKTVIAGDPIEVGKALSREKIRYQLRRPREFL